MASRPPGPARPAPVALESLAWRRPAAEHPRRSGGPGQESRGWGAPRIVVLGGGERNRGSRWGRKKCPPDSTRPSRALASGGDPRAKRARPRPGWGMFGWPPAPHLQQDSRVSQLFLEPLLGALFARAGISASQGGTTGRTLLSSTEPRDAGRVEVAERDPRRAAITHSQNYPPPPRPFSWRLISLSWEMASSRPLPVAQPFPSLESPRGPSPPQRPQPVLAAVTSEARRRAELFRSQPSPAAGQGRPRAQMVDCGPGGHGIFMGMPVAQ